MKSLCIYMYAATAAKLLQSCPTLCDPTDGSPPGPRPWDSLGKNTGVGCHFLLQCMKVKSESEVVQSCPTLSNPMDCSLLGSSIHGMFQARVPEWVAIAFSFRSIPIIIFIILGPYILFSSVQFSRSVVFDSLQPHESQHARPPWSFFNSMSLQTKDVCLLLLSFPTGVFLFLFHRFSIFILTIISGVLLKTNVIEYRSTY